MQKKKSIMMSEQIHARVVQMMVQVAHKEKRKVTMPETIEWMLNQLQK